MSMRGYQTALRRELGEEKYKQRMADIRAKRRQLGGPFRLDYVDKDGRTGSQIAAEAGRDGYQAKVKKQDRQEKE